MKIYRFIAIVVAMLSAAPALADFTPTEQQQILAAHNTERANYPGVLALQWSPELAQFAQQWANELAVSGKFRHRPNEDTVKNTFRPGQYLGENLAYTDQSLLAEGAAHIVLNWISEKQFYHYAKDDGFGAANKPPGCSAPEGSACGHFTQVIWKATQFVGCGKAKNPKSSDPFTEFYIVCNYFPAGNPRGQKPY